MKQFFTLLAVGLLFINVAPETGKTDWNSIK